LLPNCPPVGSSRTAEGAIADAEPAVRYRDAEGQVQRCTLSAAQGPVLATALPWRTFRSHRGQRHYSGYYWCATTGGHVVYESRLELARLLMADFDPGTVGIAAQPFLLEAEVGDGTRRHVPDFLLLHKDDGLTVVNVKPEQRLMDPSVKATFEWTRSAIRSRGWAWEVWSGMDDVMITNVRFLAGYRRTATTDSDLVQRVREGVRDGEPIGTLEGRVADDRAGVRAAILHLLWAGEFVADLTVPLGPTTTLSRAS
jgi:TnsA endonuclease-like protein